MIDTTYQAALRYAARQQIDSSIWPSELRDETREQIGRIVLRLTGVAEPEIDAERNAMINDLLSHTRKLKILELEAQINRQGGAGRSHPSARNVAETIWKQVADAGLFQPRHVPDDFLGTNYEIRTLTLPPGRSTMEHPGLFDPRKRFILRKGQTNLHFDTSEEATYVAALSAYGAIGNLKVPVDPANCAGVLTEIRDYHSRFLEIFQEQVTDITSDAEFQRRIVKEGWKRLIEPQ